MYNGYTPPTNFERECARFGLDPQIVVDGLRNGHDLLAEARWKSRNPIPDEIDWDGIDPIPYDD